MKKKAGIIFMGTPQFAVPALKALHKNDQTIALVVTQPDRPKGRGRKLTSSPVKETAVNLGYSVIQPSSVRTAEFSNLIEKHDPDFIVVVAFGHIIPKNILAIPNIATINIHASLLPKYRGSAPIQQAIINREKKTGVTTMLMDEGVDTGDILLSSELEITPEDTSGTLHDRLADLGADLLIQTLKAFETGDIHPISQDHTQTTYAPMLKKNDGRMNWKLPAESLEAFIRGMTPWPGAFTFHEKKRLKIFKARTIVMDTEASPGTVIKGFPDELWISTGKGVLSIIEIQGESGKRLSIKDFLRGYKLGPSSKLE
ncbi:MAG: methionyl-tRNA formyltransferase [Deltaproteobacteria bacterium]|nr:methionyl-tRNA formyltransferase [Deltaproteobacteria bacterium]